MIEKDGGVLDFTAHKLRKRPIQYTVAIRHDEAGMSFVVADVQDTEKDRLAIARDLEAAAESLRVGITSS